MANAFYTSGLTGIRAKTIDLSSDTIQCVLVDLADYTFSATHQFLSSVPAAARVGTPQTLTAKTEDNLVFDAADVTFAGLTGDQSEAILLFKSTGSDATSPLIMLVDTVASGLPVTPNGGAVTIQWAAGGIFTV